MGRGARRLFALLESAWGALKRVPGAAALARTLGASSLKTRVWRLETELADGTRLVFREHDRCVIDEVAKDDCYGLAKIKPGETVVDCGAHIGSFALMAARRAGPSGRVIAFEPGPGTLELLRENIALNAPLRLTLVPAALGEADGETTLYLGEGAEGNPAADTVFETAGRRAVTVPRRRLDAVLAEAGVTAVDHLKIDVEGAELQVLAGGTSVLPRTRRIVMEVHPDRLDPQEVFAFLLKAGFTVRTLREKPLLIEASRS